MERPVRPRAEILEALCGEISEPIETVSNKLGQIGERVTVRVAKAGPAMLGLADAIDNREWSGINNHIWLSARYATHFSQGLKAAGYDTNPDRVLNGMLDSHPGRRQWDEAGWYPQAAPDAAEKGSISNETLGMRLIQGKIPQDAFELIVALGHNVEGFSVDPSIYESWDYKIAIYTDHRTAQNYGLLNERMGDFLLGNFFRREDITLQLREQVYAKLTEIIDRQKETGAVSVEEADRIAEELGASADSARLTRKELMRLILQDADTEAALTQAGIDTDEVDDKTVPMPIWERYLRRLYINDAEEGIYELYLQADREDTQTALAAIALNQEVRGTNVERAFPRNTWWGSYVMDLANNPEKFPYLSMSDKPQGIQRAIEFFRKLDEQ